MSRCWACRLQAQLIGRADDKYSIVRLPSGEVRKIHSGCYASVGRVGNVLHNNVKLGKAGAKRWLGRKPRVCGVNMNAVDHPHGGGKARHGPGRPNVSKVSAVLGGIAGGRGLESAWGLTCLTLPCRPDRSTACSPREARPGILGSRATRSSSPPGARPGRSWRCACLDGFRFCDCECVRRCLALHSQLLWTGWRALNWLWKPERRPDS